MSSVTAWRRKLSLKEQGGSSACLALGPCGSCGNSIFLFFRGTAFPPLSVHAAWVGLTDRPGDWPFASFIPLSSDWLKGDSHVSQWRPMRSLGLPDVEDTSPTGHKPWKVSVSLAVQVHDYLEWHSLRRLWVPFWHMHVTSLVFSVGTNCKYSEIHGAYSLSHIIWCHKYKKQINA